MAVAVKLGSTAKINAYGEYPAYGYGVLQFFMPMRMTVFPSREIVMAVVMMPVIMPVPVSW